MSARTELASPAARTTGAGTDWLAIHIFYAANPRPLLVECVGPLVRRLEERGLLSGHFFINYWLEGPHVRLRLKPATAAGAPEVRAEAQAAITAFLGRRPALYEMGFGYLGELYDILFELEFPGGRPAELIGPDGRMLLQSNNSYAYRPYEPEYGKYGGPAGVALAEWHFAHSSDLVIDALRTMNLHLRPVLLGTAAQLMMVLSGTFLPQRDRLVAFLDSYHQFWHRAFTGTNFVGAEEYARMYAPMAGQMGRRFGHVLAALDAGTPEALPAFLRGWAAHAAELRDRVVDLAERGRLTFRSRDGQRDLPLDGPESALTALLSPYLHMTNNRLHVTLRDEAYLSYLLARVLREGLSAGIGSQSEAMNQ
jgi:thiopeptide-type bacteriocin biosynthesis protein